MVEPSGQQSLIKTAGLMVQPKYILTGCDSLFSSRYGVIISEILSEYPFMIAAAIMPVDRERSVQFSWGPCNYQSNLWQ